MVFASNNQEKTCAKEIYEEDEVVKCGVVVMMEWCFAKQTESSGWLQMQIWHFAFASKKKKEVGASPSVGNSTFRCERSSEGKEAS